MAYYMHNYIFFCHIQYFCRDAKNLLLVSQRYKIPKDIGLYLCRHLGYLYRIIPHPSYNSQNYIERVIFSSIDRGIYDYKLFTLFLKKFFPKIKSMALRQKYSHFTVETFTFFIRELKLKTLVIHDRSGEDYSDIDWNELLNIMPDESRYKFLLDFEYQGDNEEKIKCKKDSKSIVVYKCGDDGDDPMKLCNMFEENVNRYCEHIRKTNKGAGPDRNYYIL